MRPEQTISKCSCAHFFPATSTITVTTHPSPLLVLHPPRQILCNRFQNIMRRVRITLHKGDEFHNSTVSRPVLKMQKQSMVWHVSRSKTPLLLSKEAKIEHKTNHLPNEKQTLTPPTLNNNRLARLEPPPPTNPRNLILIPQSPENR